MDKQDETKKQIERLKEELRICHKERNEYLDGWKRSKAEFVNAKRDEEKAREEFFKYARANFFQSFLPAMDSLERALYHQPSDGTREICLQVQKLFSQHGVTSFDSIHKKFDPGQHEALGEVEVTNPDQDGCVVEELQKGYKMHDYVLRPAKVKVGVYHQIIIKQ